MSTQTKRFEHQVCYGVGDRVTFANGVWLGADIPDAKRKQADALTCPLMWEYLARAGAEGWELITALDILGGKGVRHFFLKRER